MALATATVTIKKAMHAVLRNREPGPLMRVRAVRDLWLRMAAYEINHAPELAEFQRYDTTELFKIIYGHLADPRRAVVLDVGCDANITKYVARHVGHITGININPAQMRAEDRPANMDLRIMNAGDLTFPDASFDFIYSSNVFEHLHDLSGCLDEMIRVLKPGGLCYARWEPLWSGPRGHHIHPDMIRSWEAANGWGPSTYRNDGSVIPDWSHLLLGREEMLALLAAAIDPRTAERAVNFLYDSDALNRLFFDDVRRIVTEKPVEIVFWTTRREPPPSDVTTRALHARHGAGYTDYQTMSSQVLFTRPRVS